MSLWARLKGTFRNLRRTQPEQERGRGWWGVARNASGIYVNYDTALTLSAVWSCVRVISEAIGQMRWSVYAPAGDNGRTPLSSHPVDWILSKQANPEMTATMFRRTILSHALLWGNGFAEVERATNGQAIWLWPITPDRVAIDRTESGQLIYDVYNRGQSNTVLDPNNMFHLKGLGSDGVQGYSVVGMARQSMGLGLAMEQTGASLFSQGITAQGGFQTPGKLTENQRENLTKSIDERWLGLANAKRPLLLEEDLKWVPFSINPDDAQYLESRRFQVLEICRWFRVPPHKVADLDKATFSNIEHQAIEFVVDTLVPWAVQMEQEADLKLFGSNRQNLFTKLNVASLLRGDLASRYAAYAVGRQWGWLSPNDVRRLEDMNPLPPTIGDQFLTPLNMQALPLNPAHQIVPPPSPTPPSPTPPQNLEDTMRLLLTEQLTTLRNGHGQQEGV